MSIPSVEVYTFTYNDSVHIDHLVKWNSARFKNLKITVFDNESTDDTVARAESLGCTIVSRGGIEAVGVEKFLKLKQKCLEMSESDYTLICDIDELLDVCDNDLLDYEPTIVQGVGYNMVGDEATDYEKISKGVRSLYYDKCLMFKRDEVLEINYSPGAHTCKPIFVKGHITQENLRRNLYHFRWLSLEFVSERHKRNAKRITETHRNKGYALHYFFDEKKLFKEYSFAQENAIFLPIEWEPKKSARDEEV